MTNLVTIEDAAKALKCTKANIYQVIKAKGIKTQKKPRVIEVTSKRTVQAIMVDLDVLKRIKEGATP